MGIENSHVIDGKLSTSVLSIIAVTFFMENLDAAAIAVALPAIADTFKVKPADVGLGMSAYMVAVAISFSVSSWIYGRLGSRKLFIGGVLLFAASSLWCGMSTELPSFIIGRINQGFGGGMMVSACRFVLFKHTAKAHLLKSVSLITWPAFTGPVIGPPLGGLITTHFGWSWIFFLNIPIALIAIPLVWLLLPEHESRLIFPLDVLGLFLFALTMVTFIASIEFPFGSSIFSISNGAVLVIAIFLGFLTLNRFQSVANPLVNLASFKVPTFSRSMLSGAFFRVAIGSAMLLFPLLFQVGLGMSALNSGYLMLIFFVGNLAIQPAIPKILAIFGFRRILVVNACLVGAELALCSLFKSGVSFAFIVPVLLFSGMSRAIQFMALNTVAMSDVVPEQVAHASTISGLLQQMTTGAGVAIGALGIALGSSLSSHHVVMPSAGFSLALVIAACFAILSGLLALGFPVQAGQSVSGSHR